MEKNRYTPEEIAKSNLRFSIPLYQRLFEWNTSDVIKLLNDLKEQFSRNEKAPYYIGIFTVVKNGEVYDLVDGQQRFTVLMLLSIKCSWREFYYKDHDLRLSFYARENDKNYLKDKIKGNSTDSYINKKMESALECISNFMNNLNNEEEKKIDAEKFKSWIYQNLTFFISELPNSYEAEDLNKYFESMNSAGRGLENYEILKVKMLQKVAPEKQADYIKIWNTVEQMNKIIYPSKDNKDKDDERTTINKLKDSFNKDSDKQYIANLCTEKDTDGQQEYKTIEEIKASKEKPKISSTAEGESSLISFPEFLLLVLSLQENGMKEEKDQYNFYRTDKLLDRFEPILNDREKVDLFYRNLLLYRCLLDYFIIRIQKEEFRNAYRLEFAQSEEQEYDDNIVDERKKLIQYQSMLYVSTSYYIWLKPILAWLGSKKINIKIIQPKDLLSYCKKMDNKRHKLPNIKDLVYRSVNRYWFWRLDYYLWEREANKTEGRRNAIMRYTFRENRSIEHLHPQNQNEQNQQWGEESINSFGNLAMISSSFNSSQSNDPIGIKFARIKEQEERNNLESLKLYEMFLKAKEKNGWTEQLSKEHEGEMLAILNKSYNIDEVCVKNGY